MTREGGGEGEGEGRGGGEGDGDGDGDGRGRGYVNCSSLCLSVTPPAGASLAVIPPAAPHIVISGKTCFRATGAGSGGIRGCGWRLDGVR